MYIEQVLYLGGASIKVSRDWHTMFDLVIFFNVVYIGNLIYIIVQFESVYILIYLDI